jgi:hypothetical protein
MMAQEHGVFARYRCHGHVRRHLFEGNPFVMPPNLFATTHLLVGSDEHEWRGIYGYVSVNEYKQDAPRQKDDEHPLDDVTYTGKKLFTFHFFPLMR